jgi:hypothetical protein
MPLPATGVPNSSLSAIKQKVRRLTRSPSDAQLSDADLNQYINTFLIYDFPQHLQLFDLRTTFTFFTEPFIDTYTTNSTDPTSPFYDFNNKYTSIHEPVYIAGYQQFYTQSREQFFGIYPMVNSIQSIGAVGDGISTSFTGVINFGGYAGAIQPNPTVGPALLKNNVLFSSIDINGNGLNLNDVPVTATTGNLVGTAGIGPTYINYVTGQFALVFATPPAIGAPINSQTVPYQPALPQAVLFYNDTFTLRPVPDQPYRVNLEAYVLPTVMLDNNLAPDIQQWWQYIAYGAAKKIFEDRMDMDSVGQIMPEFKKQESLVIRKTIKEYTNERTATIYTEQCGGLTSGGFGWGSGNI